MRFSEEEIKQGRTSWPKELHRGFACRQFFFRAGCYKSRGGEVIYDGAFYCASFGNGRYCGGGLQLVPKARLNDALADVMIIPKLGFFTILKEGLRAFKGTMAESPIFITSRGSVIQVEADKSDIVEVDGEMEGNLPLTISVTGSKINVLAAEGLL